MKLAVVLTVVCAVAARADATLVQVDSFGANPGALDMYEYVPAGLPAGRPLVVVMHGCTQTASAMETAGWNALADQYHFAVLYPQQRSANQSLSCFIWYDTTNTARGGGEAASIVAMVDHEIAEHAIDRDRVYVTGLSAGAAFTSVLLAAYPDRFRAGSIMSGIPYRCATDLSSGSSCQQMSSSSQKTPPQWGDLVRAADAGYPGPWPRVQIWQGSSDYTVAPANATELVKQWTNVWGIGQTASATETISTATRTRYDAGSTVAVELYVVNGMGHAIATGTDAMGMCPASSGAYFADEKICSTLRAADFFGLLGVQGGSGGDGGTPGTPGSASGGGGGDDLVDGGCAASSSPSAAVLALLALRRRRRISSAGGPASSRATGRSAAGSPAPALSASGRRPARR